MPTLGPQTPPTSAGPLRQPQPCRVVGRGRETGWGPGNWPSARTVHGPLPPGCHPAMVSLPLDVTHSCSSLHGQHSSLPPTRGGWSPHAAVPRCWEQLRTQLWDGKELRFLLLITASSCGGCGTATQGATASLGTAQGCQWPQALIPVSCCTRCQHTHTALSFPSALLHPLLSAPCGTAGAAELFPCAPWQGSKTPKSWRKGLEGQAGMPWPFPGIHSTD